MRVERREPPTSQKIGLDQFPDRPKRVILRHFILKPDIAKQTVRPLIATPRCKSPIIVAAKKESRQRRK
jgi:hypothetical protein